MNETRLPVMERVLQALDIYPGTLFNADDTGAVVLPQATRGVHLLRAFAAVLSADHPQGAEIGVERGHFTKAICDYLPATKVHAVDAWAAYQGYREHVSQDKLDGFFRETQERLHGRNVHVWRGRSVEVASSFATGSLDFVYIDSNHTLPHVIADLTAWAPKVRPGGIIAGHDFGRSSVGHVREAVQAWTAAYRIRPWFVLAGDRSPSFLWVQP